MNVKADAIRQVLEAERAKGRSSFEAAGIGLWLGNEQHRQELLSEQTRQEAEDVILEWLKAEAGDEPAAQELVARQLAQYLGEHIDIGVPDPPDLKVEAALGEWRKRGQL
jgi:hypothetical protein